MATHSHVCTTCYSLVTPRTITPGSILYELFLWLFLIVPGAFYSALRLLTRYRGCPVCRSRHIIPITAPRAAQILKSSQQQ